MARAQQQTGPTNAVKVLLGVAGALLLIAVVVVFLNRSSFTGGAAQPTHRLARRTHADEDSATVDPSTAAKATSRVSNGTSAPTD